MKTKEEINTLLNDNGIRTYRSGVTCAVFVDYFDKSMTVHEIKSFLDINNLEENANTQAISNK